MQDIPPLVKITSIYISDTYCFFSLIERKGFPKDGLLLILKQKNKQQLYNLAVKDKTIALLIFSDLKISNKFDSKQLCDLAVQYEEIALLILTNSKLLDKLGKYNPSAIFSANENVYCNSNITHTSHYKEISGAYLYKVCFAHESTIKHVQKNTTIFQERLYPSHLSEILNYGQKRVFSPVNSMFY